ncbi:MAG: glycosyltransferase, partial [Candidatus Rokubacteria bacterium]|nr:glycosyltransferase [Candidatus Rokubacteria bacterium]
MPAHPVPRLSVVVPAYNDAATLRVTLQHLAAQTLAPVAYEVVVVDDG